MADWLTAVQNILGTTESPDRCRGLARLLRINHIVPETGKAAVIGNDERLCDILTQQGFDCALISVEELYEGESEFAIIIKDSEEETDLHRFTSLKCVIDMKTEPVRTELMFEAHKLGIRNYGGLELLICEVITNDEQYDACLRELLRTKVNVVLIGMPSAGKSVTGKRLAELLNRKQFDMDSEIVRRIGMPIASFFRLHGEEAFRKIESYICRELRDTDSLIISTGGGVIKNDDNMKNLSANGTVFLLNRSLDKLVASEERPLVSNREALNRLYVERKHLYIMYSDVIIDNDGEYRLAADMIADRLKSKSEKAVIGKADNKPAEVRIPSSKSLSHRYLITGALAEGKTILRNVALNDDIRATVNCLKKLGAVITEKDDVITVEGIKGFDDYDGSLIDCNESGSTLRFLIPLFAQSGKTCQFTGRGRLLERPLSVYEDLFEEFVKENGILKVRGRLKAGRFEVRGDISSQFITGLMFLLPLLEGDSVIEVTEPFESKSYAELTADVLREFGISVLIEGNTVFVPGNQKYHPAEHEIEGDDSQAVFFAAEAALNNKRITVRGMDHHSHQSDHAFIEMFRKAGIGVEETTDGYSFEADGFTGFDVSLKDCPDLGPMLFALACRADGDSRFTDVRRLRTKESDRIAAMETELRKLGCDISSDENNVYVRGNAELRESAELDGHGDHRVVMALSVLASCIDGQTVISGAEAVNKSYPEFFDDLRKTGAEVSLHDK